MTKIKVYGRQSNQFKNSFKKNCNTHLTFASFVFIIYLYIFDDKKCHVLIIIKRKYVCVLICCFFCCCSGHIINCFGIFYYQICTIK